MDATRLLLAALYTVALAAAEDKVHAAPEGGGGGGGVPGTYFWNSDMALRQAIPTLFPRTVKKPTRANIKAGTVVFIDGYKAGMTVAAIASMRDDIAKFPHLNPKSAHYYTTAYRWLRRFLDLLPEALSSAKGAGQMHKVWRKRFMYNELWVPQWLRKALFFVDDWKQEEALWPRYIKYAEPAFGKFMKYPSKKFDNWNSMRIPQTVEGLDRSKASVYALWT